MEAHSLHLEGAGLAQRRGTGFLFARDLITTLKGNELSQEIDAIARRTGLAHQPSAAEDYVSGVYRARVTLASGRFAMIRSEERRVGKGGVIRCRSRWSP